MNDEEIVKERYPNIRIDPPESGDVGTYTVFATSPGIAVVLNGSSLNSIWATIRRMIAPKS